MVLPNGSLKEGYFECNVYKGAMDSIELQLLRQQTETFEKDAARY